MDYKKLNIKIFIIFTLMNLNLNSFNSENSIFFFGENTYAAEEAEPPPQDPKAEKEAPEQITISQSSSSTKPISSTVGYTCNNVQSSIDKIVFDKNNQQLVSAVNQYKEQFNECMKNYNNANMVCLLENQKLEVFRQKNIPEISSALLAVASISQACKKIGDSIRTAQGLLTGYQAICGGAKYFCNDACEIAKKTGSEIRDIINQNIQLNCKPEDKDCISKQANNNNQINFLNDEITNVGKHCTLSSNVKKCDTYGVQAALAAGQAVALWQSMEKAKKCEDDTSIKVDCSKSQFANMKECICVTNPRAAGCSGVLSNNMNTSSPNSFTVTSPADLDLNADIPSTLPSGDAGGTSTAGSPTSGSGVGGIGSGSTPGLEGGSGAAAPATPRGGAAQSALNAISVEEQGGGGGGFRSGSSSGRSNSAGLLDFLKSNNKYSNFLPGGKEDPNRSPANATKGEITSSGGQSNWDKVNMQFVNKQHTLGNGK